MSTYVGLRTLDASILTWFGQQALQSMLGRARAKNLPLKSCTGYDIVFITLCTQPATTTLQTMAFLNNTAELTIYNRVRRLHRWHSPRNTASRLLERKVDSCGNI